MSQATTTNAKTALKQLKKNDFLAVVTSEPMTRGDAVEALEGYSYIGSYLDYLIDHFANQGKIVRNDDGTFNLKGKKTGGAARTKFRVVKDDEGNYQVESAPIEKGEIVTKDSGWSVTAGAAVKNATKAVFAEYKAATAAIKLLAPKDEKAEPAAE